MADYRETFKRKEVKYRLTADQRALLEGIVGQHLVLSPFGESTVNSLYLDTPDHSVIARSLEKPLYKEKLRFRWYGDEPLSDATDVFFELKKKFKGIVYKRRVGLTTHAVEEVCSGHVPIALDVVPVEGLSDALQNQIAKELLAALRRHDGLVPAALIRCVRTPYEEADPQGLRITFDGALRGIDLIGGGGPEDLLAPGEAIMEIKCNGPYPFWLVQALNEAKARPSSFSKYGELYQRGLVDRSERMKHAG